MREVMKQHFEMEDQRINIRGSESSFHDESATQGHAQFHWNWTHEVIGAVLMPAGGGGRVGGILFRARFGRQSRDICKFLQISSNIDEVLTGSSKNRGAVKFR